MSNAILVNGVETVLYGLEIDGTYIKELTLDGELFWQKQATPEGISDILSENSPQVISDVFADGLGLVYWDIGDEVDITLSDGAAYNETLTMQIYGS